MRLGGETVGRWGIVLLVATGVLGAALGWHGWTGHSAAEVPGLTAGPTGASATAPAGSGRSAGPTAAPGPAASAGRSASASAASRKPGPLLSSEPFASFAFQVWPGKLSTAARAALTGLKVSVRGDGSGVWVTAGVNGQPPAQPHLYLGGTRVYVVEASMGDDSGNTEYNLGDDGLVVVNAQGRIIE